MRTAFQSERRIVEQLLKYEMKISRSLHDLKVARETHFSPQQTNLNRGFCLDFGESIESLQKERKFDCTGQNILPAALGLEVFLAFEKETFVPISLELLTGGGMPYRYFQKPCAHLLQFLFAQLQGNDLTLDRVLKQPLSKVGYARIFWMYNEITFLIFSKHFSSIDDWRAIYDESSNNYCVRVLQNSDQICLDGWLSHTSPNYDPRSKQVFREEE